jgi:hypothetical protein
MIVDNDALTAIANAIQSCAATAKDEAGLKIKLIVSADEAYRAAIIAMTAVQTKHSVPTVFPSNHVFLTEGGVFPPGNERTFEPKYYA